MELVKNQTALDLSSLKFITVLFESEILYKSCYN